MKMDWVFGMHKDIEIPKIKRQASQKHTFIYNMKMDWVFDLPEDTEIPKVPNHHALTLSQSMPNA